MLPAITCPVLVVHGDQDLITLPAYNQRVAAAIPGAMSRRRKKGAKGRMMLVGKHPGAAISLADLSRSR